jgi:transcriptional regulator GlxA family with amidase domain
MTDSVFRLGILALEGCMLSSIAGPTDALRVAQRLLEIRAPSAGRRFETVLLSARGAEGVRTGTGIELGGLQSPTQPLHMVLVPGLMHDSVGDLLHRIPHFAPEIDLLRDLHLRGVRLATACCSTFLLAETGLLDGRSATTSWWLDAAFRQRFPKVALSADRMLVEDGPFLTCGASTAVMSLVLRLVGEIGGEELSQQTGRMLLIDAERHSQAPYVSLALIERPRHSLSERAEQLLQQELHRDVSVARLAEHCGTSERSLLRHFRAHYGVTPLEHIQHLRVERAKALLESTHLSLDEIVERCGYSDASSFRKLFKRSTSLTPADYRERFRLRPH